MDGFDLLNYSLSNGIAGSAPKALQAPRIQYPTHSLGAPVASWGSLAGSLPAPHFPAPGKAIPPERFDIKIPLGQQTPEPARSTQNDLFGSIGGAIGNVASVLNPGNLIPWLIERPAVLAHNLAQSGVPGASIAGAGLDAFLTGVKGVSDVLAPVLDAVPNFYRDQHLEDRARLYRDIVTNQDPGPMGAVTLANFMDTIALGGGNTPYTNKIRDFKAYAELYQHVSGAPVTPKSMAELIDLPEDVMAQIRANPGIDLNKAIDAGKEGRQFSYRFGPASTLANIAAPLALYVGELGGATAALRGGVGLVGRVPGAAQALTAARTIPGTSRAFTAAGAVTQPFTLFARATKYAAVAGVGVAGGTAMIDAIARFQGNQAAVDAFDAMTREQPISNLPSVQLVTSFAVNPFEALGLAKKGVVSLAGRVGGVSVPVGKALGFQMVRLLTHEDALNGIVAKMYGISVPEVPAFIDQHYGGNRGAVIDEVVGLAADVVQKGLPRDEAIAFNALHPDSVERTAAFLRTYAPVIRTVLTKGVDDLANRFNTHAWAYHGYNGPFDPEIAALNARDFRAAKERTWAMREDLHAVVGYAELIPPAGQEQLRGIIDALAPTADSTVSLGRWDAVIKDYPALAKYDAGMVTAGKTHFTRDELNTILDRATLDYASVAKTNPIHAATGADPVLRPDSPTPVRDLADAMATDEATVMALQASPKIPAGKADELMRGYLRDKASMEPAAVAALTPDEVAAQAMAHFDALTNPWHEAGTRVVAAEAQIASIDQRLAQISRPALDRAYGVPGKPGRKLGMLEREEYQRLTGQRRMLQALVESASGGVTYAEATARAGGYAERAANTAIEQARREAAVAKVNAQRALGELADIAEAAKPAAEALGMTSQQLLGSLVRQADGSWGTTATVASTLSEDAVRFAQGVIERSGPRGPTGNLRIGAGGGTMTPFQVLTALRDPSWRDWLNAPENGTVHTPTGEVPVTTLKAELAAAVDGLPALRTGAERALPELDLGKAATALGMPTNEAALAKLGRLREAQDSLLDPNLSQKQGLYRLRQQAERKVAPGYVESLAGRLYPIVTDPIGELAHLNAIERVRLAIDGGTYEAVGAIVESDARLRGLVGQAAEKLGIAPETMLAEARYARDVRSAVVPPDFTPPLPGAEETALDLALTGGDAQTLGTLLSSVRETMGGPADAIAQNVTRDQAAQLVAKHAVTSPEYLALSQRIRDLEAEAVRGGGKRVSAGDPGAVVGSQGYVYHFTDNWAADRIGGGGLHPQTPAERGTWEDGATDPRTYFVTPEAAAGFGDAGSSYEVALRVKADKAGPLSTTDMQGETYATRPIPVQHIEVWAADGRWHPLGDVFAKSARPVRDVRREINALRAERKGVPRWVDEGPATPPSQAYHDDILARGGTLRAEPDAAVLADPANKAGLQVLSILNHGVLDTLPATNATVVELLRSIEKGYATKIGVGQALSAEAQKVANALLDRAKIQAANEGIAAGIFTKGTNPAMLNPDWLPVARDLLAPPGMTIAEAEKSGKAFVIYDGGDPGSLQYGVKKPPLGAIPLELQQVPGLAEEFFTKTFQPFEQRVGTAHTRAAFNYLFGKHSNATIRTQVFGDFLDRARAQGVDAETASAVWDRWHKAANESTFNPAIRRRPTGEQVALPTGERWYRTAGNIANHKLTEIALDELNQRAELISNAVGQYRKVDWAGMFRDASAPGMFKALEGLPLGRALEAMYGAVYGSPWVSTMYGVFRFASDLRMAAMNFTEGMFLYGGRAALRPASLDRGLLGMTEGNLRRMAELGPMDNTGYSQIADRFGWVYRDLRSRQLEALRPEVKGIAADSPELMAQALDSLVRIDPELRDMQQLYHATPGEAIGPWTNDMADRFIKASDAWHQKMLATVNDGEAAASFDAMMANHIADDPAMSEVYGALREANLALWSDVRSVYYGSAERSRVERVLNSYLLYWPLSYQIKAAKWLTHVMFDRAGGIRTNAFGGYLLNDMVDKHNQMLAADPEYRAWFEKHQTLTFIASMLLPITPDSMGVSLNPILRDLFFGRSKQVAAVGPVYTIQTIGKALGEVYPELRDVPGMDAIYRSLTGMQPGQRQITVGKVPAASAPTPWQSLQSAAEPLNPFKGP